MNDQELIVIACKAYTKELYKLLEFHNSIRPRGKDFAPIPRAILNEIHTIEDFADYLCKEGTKLVIKPIRRSKSKTAESIDENIRRTIMKSCAAYFQILERQSQVQNEISIRRDKSSTKSMKSNLGDEFDKEMVSLYELSTRISDSDRYQVFIKSSTLKGMPKTSGKKRGRKKKV